MRILVVNTLYPPSKVGGAERSVQLLARGLVAAGHTVAVACLHEHPEPTVQSDDGVEVYRFPLRNRHWPYDLSVERGASERLRWHVRDSFNRTATDDLLGVVDDFAPDVVNTNNLTGFSTEVWRGLRHRSVPIVHTLRDYSLVCSRATLFSNGSTCARRCAPCWGLTLRKRQNSAMVDDVVGISAAVVDHHRRLGYFTGTTTDVIHNIAGTDAAAPIPELDGPPVFGFLGRIETEKGIEILLEASASLADQPHVVRVGGTAAGGVVDRLNELHPHARIEWLGQVDADAFFAAVDTLVVPAVWSEPMGRTVIEAAVRGVSVIHSNAGGIPEVATLCAQRREVPAGDVRALSLAMAEVIDSPAEWRRRHPVSASALEPFSPRHVIDRHLAVFERAVRRSG